MVTSSRICLLYLIFVLINDKKELGKIQVLFCIVVAYCYYNIRYKKYFGF